MSYVKVKVENKQEVLDYINEAIRLISSESPFEQLDGIGMGLGLANTVFDPDILARYTEYHRIIKEQKKTDKEVKKNAKSERV